MPVETAAGAKRLSSWVSSHNSSRAKPLRGRPERLQPEQQGPDLDELDRLTLSHRNALAEKHGRAAARAAALRDRALPWHPAGSTLGVPFLGPWWGSGRELPEGPFGPPLVQRVRREKGQAPRKVLLPAAAAWDSTARWHAGRERGQISRTVTVAHCGEGEVAVSCGSCGGSTGLHPVRCGTVRLCVGCMARRSMKVRARFARAHRAVYADAFRRGLVGGRARFRPGGRYSERHLVLTVPHEIIEGDRAATARARIRRLFDAWKHFVRAVQRYYRRHGARSVRLYRCFEWTMGKDGMGHPHLHVWIFGPYLPERDFHRCKDWSPSQSIKCQSRGIVPCSLCAAKVPLHRGVRSWWADACERAGIRRPDGRAYTGEDLNITIRGVFVRLLEFVREIRKPNGMVLTRKELRIQTEDETGLAAYFEPWTISGVDPATGERASSEVLAAVYCELEGRRLSQGSRGFLGLGDAELQAEGAQRREGCPCCGEVDAPKRIDVTSWEQKLGLERAERSAWSARGPPPTDTGWRGPPASEERVIDPRGFSELLAEACAELRAGDFRRPRDPSRER